MGSGERPVGTAKGKQSDTEALCQTPPPAHSNMMPCRRHFGMSQCCTRRPSRSPVQRVCPVTCKWATTATHEGPQGGLGALEGGGSGRGNGGGGRLGGSVGGGGGPGGAIWGGEGGGGQGRSTADGWPRSMCLALCSSSARCPPPFPISSAPHFAFGIAGAEGHGRVPVCCGCGCGCCYDSGNAPLNAVDERVAGHHIPSLRGALQSLKAVAARRSPLSSRCILHVGFRTRGGGGGWGAALCATLDNRAHEHTRRPLVWPGCSSPGGVCRGPRQGQVPVGFQREEGT